MVPGLRGLRCVHALTRGDLNAGIHDNLLAVILFGTLGVLWLRWAWAQLTGGTPPRFALGLRGTVLMIGVLVAFAVLRNLPAGAGLAPPLV